MSKKKLALIATKGTLDWAYPPFILASTAAALDYEVQIFFTFYGLQLLKKDMNLKVSPLGNPGMPMPMGMDSWMPNIVTALPGMEAMMSSMMKSKTIATTTVIAVSNPSCAFTWKVDIAMMANPILAKPRGPNHAMNSLLSIFSPEPANDSITGSMRTTVRLNTA